MTSVKEDSVCLEFCTSYLGKSYESYVMELSLTDAAPLSVIRHDLPYFVPLQQIVGEYSAVTKETAYQQFVWAVYQHLHGFVARRQETVLAKVGFIHLPELHNHTTAHQEM